MSATRAKINEQASMFLRDPSGNTLELKALADPARLFATDDIETAGREATA